MPAPSPTELPEEVAPCGAAPNEPTSSRESGLVTLMAAVHAADTHDEQAEHLALELSPAAIAALGREPRQLERPLQVMLRFAGEGPRQPLVVDVLEYADGGRHLVLALPPDLPVRPPQGGEIHLLNAEAAPGTSPLFRVRRVEPGALVQLAVVEVGGAD